MNRKAFGKRGEEAAKKYLEAKGYTVLEMNYRTRLGEIDLIARQDETIVFIEVKTRHSTRYGLPRESVTYSKQLTYGKLALQYLQHKGWLNRPARFDVLDILYCNQKPEFHHIINAFEFQNKRYFF
ncbi:MAG: YraN family protein [Clostridia bacterium]|jgi:putative endonuclease